MIRLENISKSFGKQQVLKNISLSIDHGENLSLLGLSGSGKTTLLRIINQLEIPESGSVYFNNSPIANLNILEVRRQMGYVIQHGGLFPHYSVLENIGVVPRLLGWSKNQIKERADELLLKLHLDPKTYIHKMPWQMSGGQQQRIGIARALAANPPVILMDEPFGALDPITRTNIRHEFMHLDELKEKTIILVTHDVQEAFEMGDKIALLRKGELLKHASPLELLEDTQNNFLMDFIGDERFVLMLKEKGLYERFTSPEQLQKMDWDTLKQFLHD